MDLFAVEGKYQKLIDEYGDMRELDKYIENSKKISFYDTLLKEVYDYIKKYLSDEKGDLVENQSSVEDLTPLEMDLLHKLTFIVVNFRESYLVRRTSDFLYNLMWGSGPLRSIGLHRGKNVYYKNEIVYPAAVALVIQGTLEGKKEDELIKVAKDILYYNTETHNIYNNYGSDCHNIWVRASSRIDNFKAMKIFEENEQLYKDGKINEEQYIMALNKEIKGLFLRDPDSEYVMETFKSTIKKLEKEKNNKQQNGAPQPE